MVARDRFGVWHAQEGPDEQKTQHAQPRVREREVSAKFTKYFPEVGLGDDTFLVEDY